MERVMLLEFFPDLEQLGERVPAFIGINNRKRVVVDYRVVWFCDIGVVQ